MNLRLLNVLGVLSLQESQILGNDNHVCSKVLAIRLPYVCVYVCEEPVIEVG